MSLLEINILSAQDLPPVSKMLRTFAVAYMHPDHKLTTKVDHQGHTNPTWNYKIVFHVDDKFLKQESSAVTIEIYNVAWLRDLPIGTTRLIISNLNPPLHKNPSFRRVSLQIWRPSGHFQGTLNLSVQFIQSTIPSIELNISAIKPDEEIHEEDQIQDQERRGNDCIMEEYLKDREKKNATPKSVTPIHLKSNDQENNSASKIKSNTISPMRPKSEAETRSFISSRASLFSHMRSLPSVVAAEMKKGLYSTDWQEYGSSVFESWTESGDKDEDIRVLQSKWAIESGHKEEQISHVVESKWTSESGDKDIEDHMLLKTRSLSWRPEDPIPRKSEKKKSGFYKKKRSDSGKGLMSCFGNAYGFQFSFICGSKAMKKKNNRKKFQKMNVPAENLNGFYA